MPNKTTQITVGDVERWLEKLERLSSIGAKLVHVRNLLSQQQQEDYQEVVDLDIMKDEKGESVQIPCPALMSGCAVYHTDFKMTYAVKARNEFRKELRQALADRLLAEKGSTNE